MKFNEIDENERLDPTYLKTDKEFATALFESQFDNPEDFDVVEVEVYPDCRSVVWFVPKGDLVFPSESESEGMWPAYYDIEIDDIVCVDTFTLRSGIKILEMIDSRRR